MIPKALIVAAALLASAWATHPASAATDPPSATSHPATAASKPVSGRIAARINVARRAHGVRPLRVSPSLLRSSRAFARRLVRSNRFAHARRLPISPAFRVRGETLARLARPRRHTARRVVAAWLRSPGHRRLLLDPRFRWIGVGGHRTVWVAHLGRR